MSRLQHKRGRKSNYVLSYLQTDYWREVRMMVIARDRCCRRCGSRLYLEVHHITYYYKGQSIVGREKEFLFCLVLLCSKCHEEEDKNPTFHLPNP